MNHLRSRDVKSKSLARFGRPKDRATSAAQQPLRIGEANPTRSGTRATSGDDGPPQVRALLGRRSRAYLLTYGGSPRTKYAIA